MAQLGSALPWGGRGRTFKSCRSDHCFYNFSTDLFHPMFCAFWYTTIIFLVKMVFKFIGGIQVQGQEKVPATGPIILAPNHLSYIDPPAVAAVSPRRLCFMAKEELFKVPIFGRFIHSMGAFPVQRGANDVQAIRKAKEILQNQKALLLFPEGKRGDGKALLPISPGIAVLAKRTKAKIVPVGIIGTHLMLPKNAKKFCRTKIQVIFGQPFTYDEVATGDSELEKRQSVIKHLEKNIVELCRLGGLSLTLPC